jgi:hypothetical protein
MPGVFSKTPGTPGVFSKMVFSAKRPARPVFSAKRCFQQNARHAGCFSVCKNAVRFSGASMLLRYAL